ncbi:MAG: PAS domain S-box protein, partial [Proteobacteria bacterium]
MTNQNEEDDVLNHESNLMPTQEVAEARLPSPLESHLMEALIDSAGDAIISKNLDGIITTWNKGAERVFGYTAQEVIGKPILILIPLDRYNEEPDIIKRIRAGERIDHYETIRKRKDGTLIDISLTVSPIHGPDGKIIGASKIARDVTEIKRTKLRLQASEERYRT